jgi:cell division protein FtsI (penicillin-binding protein 3)
MPGGTVLADPGRRLRAALLLFAIVLSLFAGRLFQIQGLEASAYAAEADQHRTQSQTISAVRGTISDADGVALATTVEARDITVDQTRVVDPAASARLLAPLVDLPVADVKTSLTGDKRFAYVAKALDPATWKRIKALEIPGIYSQVSMRRVYPAGELGANVIGFVGADGRGLGGLEYGLDEVLAGTDGTTTFEVGAGGQQIPTGAGSTDPAVDGSDVTLTIDRDIQHAAQQAIAKQVKRLRAESGTVIVTDPATGAILAMATAPTFDPNDPAAASPENRGNRALTEVYEPGSTSKIMTMAGALEDGAVTPRTKFTVPNQLRRGEETFNDDVPHPTWYLTTAGVLARSSNLGTILAAERLGRERLGFYLEKFGIGQETGLGVEGESPGILAPASQWDDQTSATIPFGQGLSVNAMQATSVFSTIANGGVRVAPSLVKSYTGPDGEVVAAPAPKTERVVSEKTAEQMRGMMEAVATDQGTAPLSRIPGYRVAGKTGTANRVDATCSCYRGYTSSFIGMAPADAPKLVVSVVLQNPKGGYFGGQVAAPVFREVASFALQALRIPPTGAKPSRYPLTFG